MHNLETENRKLRQRLQDLNDDARHNESLLQIFLGRELRLLEIDSLAELLVALTDGLRSSFGLQDVSFHLVDPEHRVRNLFTQTGLSTGMFPRVKFADHMLDLIPVIQGMSAPRIGSYQEHIHAGLFAPDTVIRSVALLPLNRGDIRGSINLGSDDPQRYTHHQATDFLHRLSIIAAVCLENAINREQLIIHGYTDSLTNLRNRRYLEIRLQEEVASALRYRQPLSCLFLDIDHFKRINDIYGHATGDMVLRELGACLVSQLRASDAASRYGGEEFAVLLPHTDIEHATQLAERIRMEIATLDLTLQTQDSLRISISIGVSTFSPDPEDPRSHLENPGHHSASHRELANHLLSSADKALYRAKANGRNRVEIIPWLAEVAELSVSKSSKP